MDDFIEEVRESFNRLEMQSFQLLKAFEEFFEQYTK